MHEFACLIQKKAMLINFLFDISFKSSMKKALLFLISFAFLVSFLPESVFATISLSSGNNSAAPANNFVLNFTWSNSTFVGTAGSNYNATANITFNLPSGVVYTSSSGLTNLTVLSNTSLSSSSTVIFGNTSSNDTSDKGGWIAFNVSTAASGTYTLTVNETYSNGTRNYVFNNTIYLGINSTTPSIFILISPSNSTTYPTTTVATAYFTSGDTGANITLYKNGSIVNSSTSLTSVSQTILLGVGAYNYSVYYNGTGNYSALLISNITVINIGTPTISITISPSNSTTYPTNTTATASFSAGDTGANISLYRNGSIVNSSTSLTSVSESKLFGVGTYNYSVYYNGTGNYSALLISNITVVSKGTPTISILISPSNSTAYPRNTTAVASFSAGDTGANISLLRNGSIVNSSTSLASVSEVMLFGSGTYNYSVYYNGTANYSALAVTNITIISLGTPPLSISFSPSNSVSAGTQTSAAADGCPNITSVGATDVSCTFSMAPTASGASSGTVGSPDVETLGGGTYTYAYVSTVGANWTAASTSAVLSIVSSGGGYYGGSSGYSAGTSSSTTTTTTSTSSITTTTQTSSQPAHTSTTTSVQQTQTSTTSYQIQSPPANTAILAVSGLVVIFGVILYLIKYVHIFGTKTHHHLTKSAFP
jgi:hypothetical protein